VGNEGQHSSTSDLYIIINESITILSLIVSVNGE